MKTAAAVKTIDMTRGPIMKNVFLATAAILSLLSCTKKQKQPNIIFILADDMGYGDVSYFDNNSKLKTENLDRMAQEGVVFTDAHSSSSVSTPTRYGILTGRYYWRSTLKNNVLYGIVETLFFSFIYLDMFFIEYFENLSYLPINSKAFLVLNTGFCSFNLINLFILANL